MEKMKLKSFSMLVGHYAGTQQLLWHSLHYVPSLCLAHSLSLTLYTSGNVGLRFRNLWHKNWQQQRRVSYACVWFASMTAPKDLFIAAFKLASFSSSSAPPPVCPFSLSLCLASCVLSWVFDFQLCALSPVIGTRFGALCDGVTNSMSDLLNWCTSNATSNECSKAMLSIENERRRETETQRER